jgi:outer membrane autotransporter protein
MRLVETSVSRRSHLSARLFGETCLSAVIRRLAPAVFLAMGFTWLASPVEANDLYITSEAELRAALAGGENGDSIIFSSNITLTDNLPTLTRDVIFYGQGHVLSGNNQYRGLFIQSGTVTVNDLTITNAVAQGGRGGNGDGGGGGGGGAGLGAALFISKDARVSVYNVALQNNAARGGNGASGGYGNGGTSGGGGGYWPTGANGGDANFFVSGGGGTGGGGDGYKFSNGGDGGFGGGGGGGGIGYWGGRGGFGGGGGTGGSGGGNGPGGFLGGSGGWYSGGGGAGLGGAIFVQEGGTLSIDGSLSIAGNSVAGGVSPDGRAYAGQGVGSGLFLAGNGTLSVNSPDWSPAQTISDAIVDQTGAGGTGANAGSWSLVKGGPHTLILTGRNAYTGGTTVNGGVLQGNTTSLQGNILNNASVVFDQNDAGTYAGTMSGTGKLTLNGSGTLTLTGTNSYSGGTFVSEGTLQVNSDANLGAPGAAVSLNNGTLAVAANPNGQSFARPITITNLGAIYTPLAGNGTVTFSGPISGTGMLVADGSGTINLTGTNTYEGGTRVSGGSVLFTSDANFGAAGTTITLENGAVGTTDDAVAALSMDRLLVISGSSGISVGNNPLVWHGDISGSGQFVKAGPGVLQLTGTNTYTGGTAVEGGTLQIASDDKLGAAGTELTLINNGHLWATESFTTARPIILEGAGGGFQLDAGTTLTLTGTISKGGSGPYILSLVGAGTLVLTGTSSGYDGVNNFGGTLQGNTDNLRGNIFFDTNAGNTNARSIMFDQATDGTFAGNITGVGNNLGLGTITKTGAGKLILSGESHYKSQFAGVPEITVWEGTLQGTSKSLQGAIVNNAALIFDQTFDGTYAGDMSGTGTLTKNGIGKLNLTGTSSVGGGTTINAGGFAVNGHLTSNVTVNKGGTLSGVGNITGDIINNGGTIKPGNSIGHLTLGGNLTFNAGTLEVEVNAAGDSDRISVVGPDHKVMIHAGTLFVAADPGLYTPGTRYTIVTTEAGGHVAFDDVDGGTAFLSPQVSIDPQHIYVTLALEPGAFRAGGVTGNQQAVGGALDAIAAAGNSDALVNTVASTPFGQGAAALQTLSGEPYADFATVDLRASQLFMNAVGRQMAVARGVGSGGRKNVALTEDGTDVASPLSVWASGIGTTGSVAGNANAADLDYTLGGTAFGIDYRVDPRVLFGVAGGYVSGTQSVRGFAGDGDIDAVSVVAYGSFTEGAFYADALAGYANASNSLKRIITLPGAPGAIANGDTDANQFLGQIETGYKIGLGLPFKASVTPFGRFQVASVDQNGFAETGDSLFNLVVAPETTTSVRTTFGADFTASFDLDNGTPLDLGLRLGWVHEFADPTPQLTAAFMTAPGQRFRVSGATPQRDSALIGLSLSAKVNEHASLFASYDAEVGGGNDSHQLWGGVRLTW